MWRTRNGGHSWSRTPITSRSSTNNVRPMSPRGLHRGEAEVVWMRGHYGHYRTFGTSVFTRPLWSGPLTPTTPAPQPAPPAPQPAPQPAPEPTPILPTPTLR